MSENQTSMVYRHELKYLINKAEAQCLRNLLKSTMQKDVHVRDKDYYIRSLYFDTLADREYTEKVLGVCNRKKIRLRIYSVESQSVKLEIKNKFGSYSMKESAMISRTDAEMLINGNVDVLMNYNSEVTAKAYAYMKRDIYKPTVLVDYEREAYFLPIENIRLTFDKRVRASTSNQMFSPEVLMTNVMQPEVCVLEVKYDHYLPRHIISMISGCTMQNSAVSKYAIARNIFL